MKRLHRIGLVLMLLVLARGPASGAARAAGDPDGDSRPAQTDRAARVRLLAVDVQEIANSSMLSHAKKEKRIASTVRVAVVAATAYRHDSREVLGLALDLTAAAARAAPAYAEVIANAVSFAPSLARIDGAPGQVRATAMAAAKGHRVPPAARVAVVEPADEPTSRAPAEPEAGAAEPVRRHAGATIAAAAPADDATGMETSAEPARSSSRGFSLGDNSSLNLTAELGVRYDDNIFLSNASKTGDTIFSAAPGLEFQFGRNSLAHGSLGYKEAFNRYAGGKVPDVPLGNATGNFGYEDGGIAAVLSGNYQQFYQNNPDVLALGKSGLIRSNVLGLNGNLETLLGAKTSVKLGANFSDTQYVTPGFVNSRYVGIPLNVYYKITPKADVSAGYSYAVETPGGGGPKGRDSYYNLGARGSFTPKLTGTFSLGYQTRSVENNPKEKLFAFSGAFDYELTAKTSASLSASRNFGASALGQSTTNAAYSLGLTSGLSPQWQLGGNVSYQNNDYGAQVFNPAAPTSAVARHDRYWQGSLLVTYLYSQWLSTSASYTLRNNHSTDPGVEFSNNILSLTLGLRY